MEDMKISQLPIANEVNDTDVIPIIQGNITKQISIDKLFEKVNAVIETLKEKSIIRVGLQNSITVSASNDRKEFRMPFNIVRYQNGNLTYDAEKNEILVGANISTILVNVQLYFYDGVELSHPKIISIRRNQNYTDKSTDGSMSDRVGMSINQTTIGTHAIIPVQEGDRISIRSNCE